MFENKAYIPAVVTLNSNNPPLSTFGAVEKPPDFPQKKNVHGKIVKSHRNENKKNK